MGGKTHQQSHFNIQNPTLNKFENKKSQNQSENNGFVISLLETKLFTYPDKHTLNYDI